MKVIDWPRDLVEEISLRRVVIFFGSGVSANSLGTDNKSPLKNPLQAPSVIGDSGTALKDGHP
ncbi:hypothetical protein VDS02_19570, partial [Xanthomonas campestris pv. campestris]|nr:hypothetical protein [Xanthomonas campestris pv. campestris]MEB1407780.1 hypothetical protein [Xanthomonas campestris pv. campestris]MEB1428514.1 hypothetical protein [Xanthomonas campestris pv. campestris]MEB1523333.1 hypothetical protein [Xanthomonas campestris pv. campestris]MEB1773043.1 hypothetical protein [Xanthomonas campestris pv. campestris]